MTEMNVTEALLKAILELIEKCETLEELRESVKRIMHEQTKRVAAPTKAPLLAPEKVSREPYPGHLDYKPSKAEKSRRKHYEVRSLRK